MDIKPLARMIALSAAGVALVAPSVAQADFVNDTKADLQMRNLYFDHDNRQGNSGQHKEWGQGFVLNVQSGFTEGTVGFGLDAVAMLGLRLDGGGKEDKAGQTRQPGQLFPTKSNGKARSEYSKLGLTAKMRVSETEARIGTLQPKLPILINNDGRLLPQMFEGGQITSKEIDNLTLTGGLINHAVGRSSTNRSGLAVAGGSAESNKFWFAGGDWQAMPDLKAQYYFAKLEDYYKQNFLGLNHNWELGEKRSLNTDLRYFRTSADGKNKNAAGRAEGYSVGGYTKNGNGKIDNNTWSLAFTYKMDAHALMLGHQRVSTGSNFVQLNQGNTGEGAGGASLYLHTDRLANSFSKAGERTTFVDYTYDFADLGVPGLKAGAAYLRGSNIQAKNSSTEKEWERDLRLDYTVQEGTFKNVTLSYRNATFRSNAKRDKVSNVDQNRVIVNYTLPLM
ncbi:porin [Thiopseudomonas alkaliphila]|uniref:OprD family porin n=1 Tax=Thiopseudomonas alkaliphila TaxID=1697053 RepID=UPI00069FA9C6|nr:porin [Thiopseudomonas alkaliphila]